MIKVLLITGRYFDKFKNQVFGGSPMEYISFKKAFEADPDFQFDILSQNDFNLDLIKQKRKEYDIIHCESWNVINEMLRKDIIPDVLGPTIQSPIKSKEKMEQMKKEGFPIDKYYQSMVIRNNKSEEKDFPEYLKKIKYIHLGVDIDLLIPSDKPKKYILWAGASNRSCKNYSRMEEIMKITKLPKPYEFKIMSNYNVDDYWDVLNETKLVINTSLWESFCFAMFEAESKGIPVIYKKGLHNDAHEGNHIQVENTAEAYRNKILELLNNEKLYQNESEFARKYTINNSSYENIRKTLGEVYKKIYNKKKKNFVKNFFERENKKELLNTIRPNWDSLDIKLDAEKHLKLLNIPEQAHKILEIGCGVGRLLKPLSEQGKEVVGIDASKNMVEEGQKYAPLAKIKYCDGSGIIGEEANSFDCVFSIITFQHIPNILTVKKYIAEAHRILKMGGNFAFQILNNDTAPESDLRTHHNPGDLIKLMKSIGFKNIKLDNIGPIWAKISAEKEFPIKEQQQQILQDLSKNKIIVEVGCWTGTTTKVLSDVAKVIAIEPFIGGYDKRDSASNRLSILEIREKVRNTFLNNIKGKNVEFYEKKSEEVLKNWHREIDGVFIDGEHTYNAVKIDSGWIKFIRPTGFIAFHDVNNIFPGVKKFVEEEIEPKYKLINRLSGLRVYQK